MANQIKLTIQELRMEVREEDVEWHTESAGEVGTAPTKLNIRGKTPSGDTVYISTRCGQVDATPDGWAIWTPSRGQGRNGWPWAVADVDEPLGFAWTVWRDDVVLVEGDVEERTSAKGKPYIQVKRAVLLRCFRPGWGELIDLDEDLSQEPERLWDDNPF